MTRHVTPHLVIDKQLYLDLTKRIPRVRRIRIGTRLDSPHLSVSSNH